MKSWSVVKAPLPNSSCNLSNSGSVTAAPDLSFNVILNNLAIFALFNLPSSPTRKFGRLPSINPTPSMLPDALLSCISFSTSLATKITSFQLLSLKSFAIESYCIDIAFWCGGVNN